MALAPRRGAHEKEQIHRRTDGGDPAGGRPHTGGRGRPQAQDQRTDAVRLAQALRRVGPGRREAAAGTRSRERQAQAYGGRARDGHRHAQGDQPKKVVSSQGRIEQVRFAMSRGHSQRRSCELIGIRRSVLTYERQMPRKDAPVLQAMKRLAEQYPRYGYRRIRSFLRREGHEMSWERAHRLWRLAGLQLPKKRSRKRVAASRPRPQAPTGPNSVWAYDFVYDACANGQQIKCLTVIDEFTRECLAID